MTEVTGIHVSINNSDCSSVCYLLNSTNPN